jgi:hypothetical protein
MKRLLAFAICARALAAQDGATIYKNNWAQCHDHPVGRMVTVVPRTSIRIDYTRVNGAQTAINVARFFTYDFTKSG